MLAAVAASVISESRVRTGPLHLVRHARRHHCPAPVESPSSLPCFPWMAAGLAPFFHELLVFVLAPMECTDKRAKSQHRRSLERRLIGLVGSPAQESLAAFVGSRAQRVLGWRHAVCRAGGKTIGVREVDIFPCKKKCVGLLSRRFPHRRRLTNLRARGVAGSNEPRKGTGIIYDAGQSIRFSSCL
jgi:hypothetical protein